MTKNKKPAGRKILESGAGLIAAIAIIAIFILTARYFKSVIFGLILAYLFLPLQGFFKKYFLQNRLAGIITAGIRCILYPITKTALLIRSRIPFIHMKNIVQPDEAAMARKKEQSLINMSCYLTVLSVLVLFISIFIGAVWISTSYLASATKSISLWAEHAEKSMKTQTVAPGDIKDTGSTAQDIHDNKADSNKGNASYFINAIVYKIESLKPKLYNIKFIASLRVFVDSFLKDPENIKKLLYQVLSKTGGIFSYTTSVVVTVGVLLFNIVFTFFFFVFFLKKLVMFNSTLKEKSTAGDYISEGILSSAWFPAIDHKIQGKAAEILNNILGKLKIWMRGYCIIILIETTFYTTVFSLIGVPFGIILGLIAGCTILLPYVGPAISVLLTLTICIAVGQLSMVQLILVILSYVFMTGILDQLIIYPHVVGGALGLNELETIVIVLLGGMLGGITGMIFAVPTASILKYLIPQVYKLWKKETENKILSP